MVHPQGLIEHRLAKLRGTATGEGGALGAAGSIEMKAESHMVRRQTLLLILELCRQLGTAEQPLEEPPFAGAVYFGEAAEDESRIAIKWPAELIDIAMAPA